MADKKGPTRKKGPAPLPVSTGYWLLKSGARL
jgi:hypothetical protein